MRGRQRPREEATRFSRYTLSSALPRPPDGQVQAQGAASAHNSAGRDLHFRRHRTCALSPRHSARSRDLRIGISRRKSGSSRCVACIAARGHPDPAHESAAAGAPDPRREPRCDSRPRARRCARPRPPVRTRRHRRLAPFTVGLAASHRRLAALTVASLPFPPSHRCLSPSLAASRHRRLLVGPLHAIIQLERISSAGWSDSMWIPIDAAARKPFASMSHVVASPVPSVKRA